MITVFWPPGTSRCLCEIIAVFVCDGDSHSRWTESSTPLQVYTGAGLKEAEEYQPLCCWWLIWLYKNDAKNLKNYWNHGKWVPIWEYSARAIKMNANMTGFNKVFRNFSVLVVPLMKEASALNGLTSGRRRMGRGNSIKGGINQQLTNPRSLTMLLLLPHNHYRTSQWYIFT